jgi:hypothetical protein
MPATTLLERLRSASSAFLTTLRRGRGPRVRGADEFSVASLQRQIRHPVQSSAAYSWSLEQILSARDAQMAGRFAQPVKMAASMRTDDALSVAYAIRLAPLRSLAVRLVPASGARGQRVADEAENAFGDSGTSITRETIADLVGARANHGIAVGYNRWVAREDGSRIDVVHEAWPLEFVAWDSYRRTLYTTVDQSMAPATGDSRRGSGCFVDIVHGDGTWTVYRGHANQAWQQDAALLAGSLVWARHAFAARDFAKGSASHGNAKILGQLAVGDELQTTDDSGNTSISPQAEAYLALLGDLSSQDAPFGLAPAGSKTDYITNSSRAWEVWDKLMANAESAAARIYLGTDALIGSRGGAPGVDIQALFGVASTIAQGDAAIISQGLQTGLIDPWTAVNFGDSALAPRREYMLPDPDETLVQAERAKRQDSYLAALVQLKTIERLTQENADRLAEQYCAEPVVIDAAVDEPAASTTVPALRSVG